MCGEGQQFHSFFLLDVKENTFYIYFLDYFYKGTCFKFYLIAVLIYLYFIIYHRAHNVFGTLWRVFRLVKSVAAGLKFVKK